MYMYRFCKDFFNLDEKNVIDFMAVTAVVRHTWTVAWIHQRDSLCQRDIEIEGGQSKSCIF